MSTPADAIAQLQEAEDIPTLRAALLASLPHVGDANVQLVRREAEQRLSRLKRIAQIVNSTANAAPLAPERQTSHDDRLNLLTLVRLKRQLGEALTKGEAERVRKACHDDRCTTCSTEDPRFQSICIQWFCECLCRRFEERLQNDAVNMYQIPAELTAAMQSFVAAPFRFWLFENALFYDIPRQMDEALANVVEPTKKSVHPTDPSRDMGYEFRMYRSHARSIRRVITQLSACDAGLRP
jgi:hypothetical protein